MAPTVTVNEGHCVHNGKERHMPGDSFDLSGKEAKRLIDKGVVKQESEARDQASEAAQRKESRKPKKSNTKD